jgi:hypothetical protein
MNESITLCGNYLQEGHPKCNARTSSILEALQKGNLTPKVK